jgi:hypothetical protein
MNATTLLREQIQQAHDFLQTIVEDVTNEQANWVPAGTANPLGATYIHAVASEDAAINVVLKGGVPLFATEWAGKTGASDVQPLSNAEWSRSVQVNMPEFRQYAQAVHVATDAYLATLADDELARLVDLTNIGLGHLSVGYLLNRFVLGHIDNMTGEISVLKGLQGGRGYPF